MDAQRLILVYDGECGLCRDTVAWVRARDRAGRIQAVPFQEPGLLEELGLTREQAAREAWAIEPQGRRYAGAAAINRTFRALGGVWGCLALLYHVPPVRWGEDRLYRWVAEHRSAIPRRWWPLR
ncbi:DUF393 domain-containing protein [bacterium]|nr:DUF393 domain-containing protein [bacterium]